MEPSHNKKELDSSDKLNKKEIRLTNHDELTEKQNQIGDFDENKTDHLLTNKINDASQSLKKAKLVGYFGPEIIIDEKLKSNKLIIKTISHTKIFNENSSITNLKSPKKKSLVKFCKICGNSVKDVLYCPNCGAKID